MAERALVSIIVPVYNAAEYLKKCVDSLIAQIYYPIEILLIDDGSLDGSNNICDKYAKQYINIQAYHKKNGGAADARNFGLQKARGKWILFIDADDYAESDYVSGLISPTRTNDIDIAVCSYEINYIDENYTVIPHISFKDKTFFGEKLKDAIYELDSKGLFNVVYCKLYKRDIILDNRIFFDVNLTTGEDLVFNCMYFTYVSRIEIINMHQYHYIKRNVISLVNSYKSNMINIAQKCNAERFKLYQFYNMDSGKYIHLYGITYIKYLFSCIPNLYNNSNMSFSEREKLINVIINDNKLKQYIRLCCSNLDILTKVFAILCRIKSVYVFDFTYLLLFFIKHHFANTYIKVRKVLVSNSKTGGSARS